MLTSACRRMHLLCAPLLGRNAPRLEMWFLRSEGFVLDEYYYGASTPSDRFAGRLSDTAACSPCIFHTQGVCSAGREPRCGYRVYRLSAIRLLIGRVRGLGFSVLRDAARAAPSPGRPGPRGRPRGDPGRRWCVPPGRCLLRGSLNPRNARNLPVGTLLKAEEMVAATVMLPKHCTRCLKYAKPCFSLTDICWRQSIVWNILGPRLQVHPGPGGKGEGPVSSGARPRWLAPHRCAAGPCVPLRVDRAAATRGRARGGDHWRGDARRPASTRSPTSKASGSWC